MGAYAATPVAGCIAVAVSTAAALTFTSVSFTSVSFTVSYMAIA